ncbi:MAG: hypothetical protein HOC77_13075, partial [Chloroflexi bacterium]|nr:hypothetical protein [Chloroflexota bacterium]
PIRSKDVDHRARAVAVTSGGGDDVFVGVPAHAVNPSTPSDMPTNCLLGGHRYAELFITYGTGMVHRVADSGLKGRPII